MLEFGVAIDAYGTLQIHGIRINSGVKESDIIPGCLGNWTGLGGKRMRKSACNGLMDFLVFLRIIFMPYSCIYIVFKVYGQ
jgi:hypothetical protein